DIPASVSEFEESVFSGSSIKTIVIRGSFSKELRKDTFYSMDEEVVIYVQKSEMEKFQKVFSGTIRPLEEYQEIQEPEYRPFIEEGKVWKVGEFDQYGTFLPRLSYYYFDGDTIVGGKACKRMMCRHEANKGFEFEDGSLSYTNYAGAFYEENKQVYFALPTNDWFDRLYDFGAEIGETIDIYDWVKILGPHTSPFTITKKEEENSEFFKGIRIEVNEKEELSHIKAVWREGIGGKEGPINNLGDRDALMSCTVGDEVLYKNPYFEDLYPDIESDETTHTPTAKRRVDFTHVVKKKPKAPQRRVQENEDVAVSGEYTQRALTIDLNALQDTYAVTITDPSGKSVYAKDVKTNRVLALDIDISAYNTEEAYTITLENEDEIFEGNFRLSDLTNDLKYIELTKEERELVKNNNEFAFRLFNKARDDESCIMSPLSITYALGMLNNGADGQTREEINQVLGNVDNAASPELINQFCQKLLTEAPQLDKETTAEIANTIYVNRGTGYELQQGFVDKVNEYYDAQPQALDFYDDATIDIINQWADDHTHGMIPEIVDKTSFDHNAASILLNAIYFKGVWANKFDKAMTQDETFNGVETQPMMHQMEEFLYTENDLYQAVRLPYGNGAYEMTIFLPRKGKTIGEVLSQMDGKNWRPRYQSLYQVDLKMPRFQTETELPLNDTMKELGMPTAFTMGAEFPYFGNRDVFISQMFQKAKIELDEEGTKAAAVTEIWMAESACTDVAEFHANRPFFYIISEQSTGAIFFIGQYMGENPALAINSPALPLSKTNNTYYDLTGRRVTTPTKGIYIHNGKIVMVK
ncbi:MAG: serpin family protein, partial [Bacteroidaceae bacterium]|nr:serpin family protein [Bacteroidaceae bacterium]